MLLLYLILLLLFSVLFTLDLLEERLEIEPAIESLVLVLGFYQLEEIPLV